ncbi:MAG: TrkH family potassium uptake protein [Salaquimonas sp.]|nr:TrkH family potassium uptake protein [Salaquimonas sp.]
MSNLGATIRFLLYVNGVVLTVLAVVMAVPMLVDFGAESADWQVFAGCALFTLCIGGMLALAWRHQPPPLGRRAGYLLTVSIWLVVSLFASLPLYISSLHLSYVDAYFETVSGLTTTGSTIISGLDDLPPGLLLWRSLLNWIGGIGIVVMAIVLLPFLRTGGMQLFHTESSDISGKPVPRVTQMATLTVAVYVGLSAACAFCYGLAGMNVFDAINHGMATLATGGFSTRDASIGYYDSVPIEIVAMVFMIAGALPLIWYARLVAEPGVVRAEGRQVPVFLAILAIAIMVMTIWNVYANDMVPFRALRFSAFNVTSILTDTGFANTDFSRWGGFGIGMFFMLYLIGGCAGSTSGAIKIFRWQILFSGFFVQLSTTISPHRVMRVRYGGRSVGDDLAASVRSFFFLYLLTLGVLSLLIMATGVDFLSGISAIAQAMANAGPGLGDVGGPAGNFEAMPTAAKWLLILTMFLGRLELTTVYVLFLRSFWQH